MERKTQQPTYTLSTKSQASNSNPGDGALQLQAWRKPVLEQLGVNQTMFNFGGGPDGNPTPTFSAS